MENKTIDGWMICNFTSCLTVFQSYQDDGLDDNEKVVFNETPFTVEKISPLVRIELSPLDQYTSA